MKVITYLEQSLDNITYDGLGEWCLNGIQEYSIDKTLFEYQIDAVKNAVKVLYSYFSDKKNGKKNLLKRCIDEGMPSHQFDVKEGAKEENSKFQRLQKNNWFPVKNVNGEKIISEENFFNRTCFWMATASGKTLLIIKMIEIVDRLQKKGLIPQREIMVLFPSEKIQNQFADAVEEYNRGKARKVNLLSLKDFELYHDQPDLRNDVKVYSYRSDLFSDIEKAKKIDTVTYDNNGEWYIFMDEAHKGDKEDSLRQDYITIMSRNGFLFNFSATFTDNLDFATTCYNFNLEKFIEAGYGKNIYLSKSKYAFQKKSDDLSEKEKQLQVLKSLLTFTIIKKAKKPDYYHNPLMITLVNEVNTENSDTDLFFAELAKVATGSIDQALFETAKEELMAEFRENSKFQFGSEVLLLSDKVIEKSIFSTTLKELLLYSFNAKTFGKIEVIEGEKGKEFALKLATSDVPFALFRIGDASLYVREKLSDHYMIIKSYDEKRYFDHLNTDAGKDFNMLIGSRMFYEGWDSNRPNVMNFINIGTGDAKKFVLQSLGRGVRIEPTKNNRRRLKANDSRKEQLLETLFVFATNRNAVETILETMDTQRTDETTIELKASDRKFDLLLPVYEEKNRIESVTKFNISEKSYQNLQAYVDSFSDELLYVLANVQREDLISLRAAMKNGQKYFSFKDAFDYTDVPSLLEKVIAHLSVNDKYVSGIRALEDEIIHFKHVSISKEEWTKEEEKDLNDFILLDSNGSGEKVTDLAAMLTSGSITLEEFNKRFKAAQPSKEKEINGVKVIKFPHHFYLPLLALKPEKSRRVKHVIDVKSEIDFVNNLYKFIENNSFQGEWMFSKIDQTIDDRSLSMPYFSTKDNQFHDFYPDFIFWEKNGNDYTITFVDPKGTEHASYTSKIDGFKALFLDENGKQKVFQYKDYQIRFSLKLVYDDVGTIPKEYEDYWVDVGDFSWMSCTKNHS